MLTLTRRSAEPILIEIPEDLDPSTPVSASMIEITLPVYVLPA